MHEEEFDMEEVDEDATDVYVAREEINVAERAALNDELQQLSMFCSFFLEVNLSSFNFNSV